MNDPSRKSKLQSSNVTCSLFLFQLLESMYMYALVEMLNVYRGLAMSARFHAFPHGLLPIHHLSLLDNGHEKVMKFP